MDNMPGGGTYIGPSAYRVDNNGNTISYNEDGYKTNSIQLPQVEVTPNTGKFNLSASARSTILNLTGMDDPNVSSLPANEGPLGALKMTGVVMKNMLENEAAAAAIVYTGAGSLTAKTFRNFLVDAISTGVTVASLTNKAAGRQDSWLLNSTNAAFGFRGLRSFPTGGKLGPLVDLNNLNSIFSWDPLQESGRK